MGAAFKGLPLDESGCRTKRGGLELTSIVECESTCFGLSDWDWNGLEKLGKRKYLFKNSFIIL